MYLLCLTGVRRNFEAYYQSRLAHRMITSYVKACVTCALAQKFDLKKVTPATQRSLEPNSHDTIYVKLGHLYIYIWGM
jgi:hypothetical protein